MKKKLLSVITILAMLVSMSTLAILPADAAVEGDWTYSLYDGDTTAAITGYSGTDAEITIPSSIAGKPVTRIGSNAFLDKSLITSVTIPDSVLRIESGAFQNCSVSTINLSEGLTYIGQNAFNGSSISSVTIPNSVTHIDNNAFAMNRNLTSVTIVGNNLTTMGSGVFGTTGISAFRIPTSLTAIADWTFNDTYLSSLTIPSNITSIGYSGFGNNPGLNSVLFEGDAPAMGNFVFSIPVSGFTIYFYSGASGFTTPTWTAGLVTYNTVELDAPSKDVCQIGPVGYENISEAITAASSGDTITLLKDIEYQGQTTIADKDLTIALNGFTLDMTNETGTALEVGSGGRLSLTGAGALNVYGNGYMGHGVYAHHGGEANVTNAYASFGSSIGAYAQSGGIVNVDGNAAGTFTTLGTNTYCRGAQADGADSEVNVSGNISSANNYAAVAQETGTVSAGGAISGFYGGAHVDNGTITSGGNVTGVEHGAYALSGGTISVGGNAVATGQGGNGAHAVHMGTTITVAGDAVAQGNYGSGVFSGAGAVVSVDGNAIAEGNDGYGAYAAIEDAVIEIGGDIVAESGTGVWARQSGKVTVNGGISALHYIKIEDQIFQDGEYLDNTTKIGYQTYSDGTSTVWVALEQLVERISGSTRYSTAISVSQAGWEQSETVLLARGDNYADALAGVPLAHQLGAPILLSSTSETGMDTLDEIERLGADKVIILGGVSAISADVASVLAGKGLTVTRIAGSNRYDTAVLIAELMREKGAGFDSAIIAVGTNFPDALAAAAYAAIRGEPILLTQTNTLTGLTKDAIQAMEIHDTVIIGGISAVSDAVKGELSVFGDTVRISGSNRYSTAVEAADYFNLSADHYYIATGLNFPDAITGAVLAAKNGTGVLLVQGTLDAPNPVVQEFVLNQNVKSVTLFGGSSVIAEGIQNWFIDNL